ncbi:MAG: helix-turn-helix transcriptional regulator [Bacteroidales bacterium]|nr:helix-turn-helix transcriptional regulator [Bacteroidales bacterium]
MNNISEILFNISSPTDISDADYRSLESKMDVVEAFARITSQGVFVADLFRNNFMYVSDSPLVLFGHTVEEAMQGGYSFLIANAATADRPLMQELVETVGNAHRWLPDKASHIHTISCHFHFLVNGQPVLINHRVTPLARTKEGKAWLALCLVSPSPHSETGHIVATISTQGQYSVYTFENHRWNRIKERLELTEDERTMLHLSAQGYTMNQIGGKMFRSVDTVKMYRRHVFNKLGVSNISEAIAYAYSFNLI